MNSIRILGTSGYTGGELLRLLAFHPCVEVAVATSREYVGRPAHFVHFNLRGIYRNLKFTDVDINVISKSCDVVFMSTPHGVSIKYIPQILEIGITVIDLSADFRLKNQLLGRELLSL